MQRHSITRLIACSGSLLSEIALEAASRLGIERIFVPVSSRDFVIPTTLCDCVWAEDIDAQKILGDVGYGNIALRVGMPVHPSPGTPVSQRVHLGEGITIPPLPPEQLDVLGAVSVLSTFFGKFPDVPVTWALHPRTDPRIIRNVLRSSLQLGQVTIMPCHDWPTLQAILSARDLCFVPMKATLRKGWLRFVEQMLPEYHVSYAAGPSHGKPADEEAPHSHVDLNSVARQLGEIHLGVRSALHRCCAPAAERGKAGLPCT